MQEFHPDIIRLAYGLTYFVLGLAVGARAMAYRNSVFRDRIIALSAFGLGQAVAIWFLSLTPANFGIPTAFVSLAYVPGFLALYYFAFGWREQRSFLAHSIVIATLAIFAAASALITDPAKLQLLTQLGVAMPASLCAGLALVLEGTFRFDAKSSDTVRLSTAGAFLFYAALQGSFGMVAYFATDALTPAELTAVAGLAPDFIRGVTIVAITIYMLFLLRLFEGLINMDWEEHIAAAEHAQAMAQARLKRALDFGHLGTWEWNLSTGEVQWSEQTYRIYGLSPRETRISDTTYFECVHPEDRAAVEEEMRRILRFCTPYCSEHRIVRPNGAIRHVRAQAKVEIGADGLAKKLLGATCDITELEEAKNAVAAAKTAAEASSTAKSNFMANMSHELRTPLNAILGFSEIMESELYGPHSNPLYRTYANDIKKSGQHLLSVINDILTVSRCEAGKTELNEEAAINVEELITKCMKWVECQAADGGIELRTGIAPMLPALRGDPRLLVQALLNLISNAVKFTPRGGLVEVSAGENHLGGIKISVRDTGIGMSAEQLTRIGEPFLQFDDSRSRQFEGTGLGLTIAKQLLHLHGSKLDIQSEPKVGSTFSINFPPGRTVRHRSRQLRSWGSARAS